MTSRMVYFLRAVVVDPVMVWAPGGDWAGVAALEKELVATEFNRAELQQAINFPQGKQLRLLHGAVASLFPVLCSQIPRAWHLCQLVAGSLQEHQAVSMLCGR